MRRKLMCQRINSDLALLALFHAHAAAAGLSRGLAAIRDHFA
jgi:hypothetical protein